MLTRDPSRRSTQRNSVPPTPASERSVWGDRAKQLSSKLGRGSALGRQLFTIYNKSIDYSVPTPAAGRDSTNPLAEHEQKLRSERQDIIKRLKIGHNKRLHHGPPPSRAPIEFLTSRRRPASKIEHVQPLTYNCPVSLLQLEADSAENRKTFLQSKFSGLTVEQLQYQANGLSKKCYPRMDNMSYSKDDMCQEILKELDQWNVFMREMEALGSANKHRQSVQAEVARLLSELKLLAKETN